MGQVYMQVSAEVVDGGIMTMAASGGGSTGSYYIGWTPTGGFTGTGWEIAWNSENTPLAEAWTANPVQGYDGDYAGFTKYVEEVQPDNLNSWLDQAPQGWSDNEKYDFAHEKIDIWLYCTGPAS